MEIGRKISTLDLWDQPSTLCGGSARLQLRLTLESVEEGPHSANARLQAKEGHCEGAPLARHQTLEPKHDMMYINTGARNMRKRLLAQRSHKKATTRLYTVDTL